MSLFDKVRIRLNEVKKEPPIESGSIDPANQQGSFRKNERNKKKIMRKLEPKGPKQGELNLGNTKTTNTPLSTKRTLKGRPLGSKTRSKGETYKQLTTGSEIRKKEKQKSYKIQKKSLIDKTKKYVKGEYPKIGGGGLKPDNKKPVKGTTPVRVNVKKPINVDKIFSGTGNVKKGGNVPDKNINPKSKGTTPVKTNVSKINVDKVFDKPKNPITKTIGVKQSEVSKKAKEFTKDINKANVKRQETVAKRKYFRGRKAERLPGRSGEKPTGSIARGTYKSSPTGQRAYDYEKLGIDARERKARQIKLDRKLNKSFMKGGKYPEGLQKALAKDGVKTPSQAIEKAAKDTFKKAQSGDKQAQKQLTDIVDKDFKKKTPAKQAEYATKFDKIQRAKGRTFNVKTGKYDPSPFEKYLKKAGGSGDVSPTAGPKIRKRVETIRKTRAAKLGLDDPFDVDTSKASKEVAKKFGTKPVKGGLDFGKPGTGIKDIKFQPRDISAKKYASKVETGLKKANKSFSQFSRDLKDFKDRDVPGGPKKTTFKKTKVSFQTPGGRQKVGMAPKNKISTGQEFINKYKKGHPMNPEIEGIDFNKPKKNPPINVTGGSGGGKKPPKVTYGAGPTPQGPREPRKINKKFAPGSTGKVNVSKMLTKQNKDFFKSARRITKTLPGTKGITKTLAKLGPKGRAAAAVSGLALASPTIRKYVGTALAGGGLGFLAGKQQPKKRQLKVGDGIKEIGSVRQNFGLSSGFSKPNPDDEKVVNARLKAYNDSFKKTNKKK